MASEMQKDIEEYAEKRKEEGKLETIENMLKNNISLDVALKYTQIDKATYEKYVGQFG